MAKSGSLFVRHRRTMVRFGLIAVAVFGMSVSLQASGSLALLCAEGATAGCAGAQALMQATAAFTTVDVYDVTSGNPALATISGYNAILAWTDDSPADPAGLGNLLASYASLGGKHLTVATYAFSNPWAITGAIMSGNYAALTNLGVNGTTSGNLVATVPGDPIFTGITLSSVVYFENDNFAHPGLASGATLLATDGAGVDMIARSASGVIDVNLVPGFYGTNNAAFYSLLANTLTLGPTVTPGPAVTPIPATWLLTLTGIVGLAMFQMRERLAQLLRG
jgi:hypothetical protein